MGARYQPQPAGEAAARRLLKRGAEAIEKARLAATQTPRERQWIEALALYFEDYAAVPQEQRTLAYEAAMARLHEQYPDDVEAAVFYALALNEAADLDDKTYARSGVAPHGQPAAPFVGELTVLVPLECASAATMLALGADKILANGAAGPSLGGRHVLDARSLADRPDNNRVRVSQDELHRVVRLWQGEAGHEAANPYQALFGHVHPLVIGAVDRASALSTRFCVDILSYHMKDGAKRPRSATSSTRDIPRIAIPSRCVTRATSASTPSRSTRP